MTRETGSESVGGYFRAPQHDQEWRSRHGTAYVSGCFFAEYTKIGTYTYRHSIISSYFYNSYRLSDNDFGKAERGRRIGHTPASDNAAKIFIWKSIGIQLAGKPAYYSSHPERRLASENIDRSIARLKQF
jgi:hypothetical protein